jgi:hypothetical protein
MQKLAQASGAGHGKKALEILPALPRQRLGRTDGGEGTHASQPERGMMMAA